MEGWESWQRRMPDGAIDSEQRVALQRPVVERSLAGAEQLGRAYWRAVRRATASLVAFYDRLQGRAHAAISRRYFQELVAEARE